MQAAGFYNPFDESVYLHVQDMHNLKDRGSKLSCNKPRNPFEDDQPREYSKGGVFVDQDENVKQFITPNKTTHVDKVQLSFVSLPTSTILASSNLSDRMNTQTS